MTTSISGYDAFIKNSWAVPIFEVSQLGYPQGTNIIYTDSIPIIAIIGRIFYDVTGAAVNPYGAWTVTCFVASAASLTALVGLLGARTIPAACTAAVLACCMPALLYRWGHMALMAHFQVILALAFYAAARRTRSQAWWLATSVPLCLLALWTNIYIFAMVAGLVAAATVDTVSHRRLPVKAGLTVSGVLAATIAATMALSGHLGNSGSWGATGYGYYSLNWLSPLVPQFSGILPYGLFGGILDATGGQYEGFSYPGAGILLLIVFSARDIARWIDRSPDTVLRLTLLGFVAFAVTPNSCVGDWCTGKTIDLPITATFRSSGRFVWPALYAITAAATAFVATRHRYAVPLLVAAAWLQWVDTAPLRNAFANSLNKPAPTELDAAAWQHALAASAAVRVFPSFSCLLAAAERPPRAEAEIAIEIQLLASIGGVPVNSVYAARRQTDCDAEDASSKNPPPVGSITVYLASLPGYAAIQSATAAAPNCRTSPQMTVCVPEKRGLNPSVLTDTVRSGDAAR
jgi:hypothetical protein